MDELLGNTMRWFQAPKWLLLFYYHYVFLPGQDEKKQRASDKHPKLCTVCGKGRLYTVHAAFCPQCNARVHKSCLQKLMKASDNARCSCVLEEKDSIGEELAEAEGDAAAAGSK